jgi:(4S)-4-hydroxy-5-phosphonooxypentane-2,3-dione isomerase
VKKVYLFVEISVRPGQTDAFVERLKMHAELVRSEKGCEVLEIFRDTQDESRVCVWEIWSDRPSWDAHMVIDHSKAWQKEAPQYVFGEKITVMESA